MKYLSADLIDDLYNQTEININKAISVWQQEPDIKLLTQPGAGRWSLVQCLEHLNSYGRYYLPAIEKAVARATNKKPAIYFNSGLIGAYFYKLMLTDKDNRIKKKLKAPQNHVPAVALNSAIVLNEFITQQELIGQLLSKARLVNIVKAKVGISIAPFIKLKLGDIFLFLVAHINRHVLQAEKALVNSYDPLHTKNSKLESVS